MEAAADTQLSTQAVVTLVIALKEQTLPEVCLPLSLTACAPAMA